MLLLVILSGCNRHDVPPKAGTHGLVQNDLANNAGADCERHQSDFYEELAAKSNGLQALLLLHCQLIARRGWHVARARELEATGHGEAFKQELATAMRCERENAAVLATLRKAGVINIPC